MSAAACLYFGRTMHARRAPRPHRFSYDVFQVLVDIDRIDDAAAGLRLFRRGRFGLFSFHERDHGARDGSPLRPWVQARLAEAGVAASAARIRLLAFPRLLGFVFNPISIFFVDDADGRLEAVIYEVNNTFGQSHAYVAPATGDGLQHHEAEKRLFVSPFYDVSGVYRFRISPPGKALKLTITKSVAGEPDFTATLHAEQRPMTDPALFRLFLAMPFMTLGVVAAIHWEAVRLWLKGAPFQARAPGPRFGASAGRASPRTL